MPFVATARPGFIAINGVFATRLATPLP